MDIKDEIVMTGDYLLAKRASGRYVYYRESLNGRYRLVWGEGDTPEEAKEDMQARVRRDDPCYLLMDT